MASPISSNLEENARVKIPGDATFGCPADTEAEVVVGIPDAGLDTGFSLALF